MKRKNKCFISFTLLSIIVLSLSVNSFAGTGFAWKEISKTVYRNFTDDWSITHSEKIDGHDAMMVYGFNTFAFNEDECSTLFYGSHHRPVIVNGNGTHTGYERQAHEWSEYEVRHSGDKVVYKLEYKVLN